MLEKEIETCYKPDNNCSFVVSDEEFNITVEAVEKLSFIMQDLEKNFTKLYEKDLNSTKKKFFDDLEKDCKDSKSGWWQFW